MRTNPTATTQRTAAHVRGLIASRNLSRAEVAAAIGMSEAAFGRRVRGQIPFNVDEVEKLAILFGVPASRFLEEVA
ncbi:helix-turn-helix domain-containing protein [Propionicimonas paludicola]|nr:helix-turn-helix transcriptional regulator [Propionicimonas paludicola]